MTSLVDASRPPGLTYNSTAKVSLAKFRYKVSFDGYPQILRPSLNFTARVSISFSEFQCNLLREFPFLVQDNLLY